MEDIISVTASDCYFVIFIVFVLFSE